MITSDSITGQQITHNIMLGAVGMQVEFASRIGIDGKDGRDGRDGTQGPKGDRGDRGLAGATGAQGVAGPQGERGANGTNGTNGRDGAPGATGTSAYQAAKAGGYQGTEAEFNAILANVNDPTIITYSGTLQTNRVYKTTITSATTFSPPAVSATTKVNSIVIYARVNTVTTISWGSGIWFYEGIIPTIIANTNYEFVYDYDPVAGKWCLGVLSKKIA